MSAPSDPTEPDRALPVDGAEARTVALAAPDPPDGFRPPGGAGPPGPTSDTRSTAEARPPEETGVCTRFRLARRGYDRAQVQACLTQLRQQLAAARAGWLDQATRAESAESALARALAEAASRGAEGCPPREFGSGVEKLLRLAEAEGEEIRAQARADRAALLADGRQRVADSRHELERAVLADHEQRERAVVDREAELVDREAELVDREAELVDREAALAGREAGLAEAAARADARAEETLVRSRRAAASMVAAAERAVRGEQDRAERLRAHRDAVQDELARLTRLRDTVAGKLHRLVRAVSDTPEALPEPRAGSASGPSAPAYPARAGAARTSAWFSRPD